MKIFYVESGMGCGLRLGMKAETVRKRELESVGTYNGVSLVREATPNDIANVKAMGGHVPELPKG